MKKLVTIASYQTPTEAAVVRNALLLAGIQAFLSDELMAGMAWIYSQAIHGVKVQVAEEDVAAAKEVLSEGQGGRASAPSHRSKRESAAHRALRASILSMLSAPLLIPLQIYAIVLLVYVSDSSERLNRRERRSAWAAAVISGLVLLTFLCVMYRIFMAEYYDPSLHGLPHVPKRVS